MQYSEIVPSPHLAEYVKCFWSLEQSKSQVSEAPEPVVPDGCLEIVFNLADRFQRFLADLTVETQAASIVAGQMRKSVLIKPTGNVKLFGIRFRSSGAYPFFDFSLYELTDRIESLDSVLGTEGRVIEEQINEAATFAECVGIIETFLTKRLVENKKFDGTLIRAAEIIVENDGMMSVGGVARIVGVSERRLERKFKQKIGVSPKLFSRIIRFQNILKALKETGTDDVLDTALTFGYFDQPHMIREFKEFSGKSPTAFLDNSHRLTEFFTIGE